MTKHDAIWVQAYLLKLHSGQRTVSRAQIVLADAEVAPERRLPRIDRNGPALPRVRSLTGMLAEATYTDSGRG
jgi:hypothetical protein